MESLLHAREWVTLPATLYAIHKLVIDITDQDLLQDIDWIVLPIANPDGYVHTHDEVRSKEDLTKFETAIQTIKLSIDW